MSIAEKLQTVAENQQRVYDSGQQAEYDRFWDAFQKNGTRGNYWYGFSGYGWAAEALKPKYKIAIIEDSRTVQYAVGMFYRCGGNDYNGNPNTCVDFSFIKDKFDFSGLKNANSLFNSAYMINIDVDLSNAETAEGAFARSWGGYLDNITLKVSEKLTNCPNMFLYGSTITKLTFTEDSVIACNGLDISACTNLTHDSVMSIINALADKSTDTSVNWAVTLGTANLAKLTDAEKAIATEKGWTLV